jgi:integrase|tara:strand:- start:104 stop:1195 length:1092 start_codon:yes stop_codon:yes gene_type:complete
MKNLHKLCGGKLSVYKQSTTQNWYARFFTEKKYKVRSLGTPNFTTAKEMAIDWYEELKHNQKQGIPIQGIKFKEVIPRFLKYQDGLVSGGELSEVMAKDYAIRVRGGIKYFNDYRVSEIQLKQLDNFREHRIVNDGVSSNTVRHDFVAIRQVLKYCVLQGHLQSLPDFPKKQKKEKSNPRPWFELDEWKKLQKHSQKRIEKSRGTRQRWEREQLHDFMIFMVHTGMRVEEVLRTQYQNCKIHTKQDKTKELRITIRGKTGIRNVRGMIGSVRAFERVRTRNKKHKATDLLFPQNHREGLKTLLNETGLKKDNFGRDRNAKSFRSTFIMYRLLAKQPIKAVATNCGTSSDVVDKFYAKFITIDM